MILFDKKVAAINKTIQMVYPDADIYGLCYQVKRDDELLIRQPKAGDVKSLNGNDDTPVAIDDDHELQLYHRITGRVRSETEVHGRSETRVKETAEVSLIVSTSNRMVHDILKGLLSKHHQFVTIIETEFDLYKIYQREWGKSAADRVNFENYLFSIRYDLLASIRICENLTEAEKKRLDRHDFKIFDDTFSIVFE